MEIESNPYRKFGFLEVGLCSLMMKKTKKRVWCVMSVRSEFM